VVNEPLVGPTNERHTPLASRHSPLLSDPSLELGGHHGVRYSVHGTNLAGIAPENQHADGRTTTIFSGEVPGSSIPSGLGLGRSCDHRDGPGPDAASSQTVRQHTHFHSPSVVQICKEPAVTRTSPKATNRSVNVGHPSTPGQYRCSTCNADFYAEKGLTRHIKDRHLKRNICPFCLTFKWSQGRKYLFKKHLMSRHQAILQAMLKRLRNDVVPGRATP
jgi:hypothetical protein